MIKTAVIGVGSMGQHHARVYSELPNAHLVGVADPREDVVNLIASKYDVPAYTDYHQLLSQQKPDAVTVAVPTGLHEQVAMGVMEAGSHVLIEKPIAATLEEGQRLVEKALQLGRKMMVGHIVRFNPAMQLLKQKLQDGDLGKIFQVFCRRVGPFPARIRDVGVVIDLAPHDIDIMRFLIDEDPIRVYAETEQRIHTDHEDLLFGLIRFPGGITAALELNWLTPQKIREVYVLGELGMFRVDDLTQDLFFHENAAINGDLWPALRTLKGVSEGSMIRFPIQRYEPLKLELEAFVESVEQDTSPPVTGEDGLLALKISLALVQSGKQGRAIELA